MRFIVRSWSRALILIVFVTGCGVLYAAQTTDRAVPVLVYHRFGPMVADSMTTRTSTFEVHLRYLTEHNYSVIPLQKLVDYLAGRLAILPLHSVVITVDDGHRSVFEEMLPLVQRYRVPVTAFIYPSSISNAPYAMTWEQLKALQASGWFNIQSHTYWHPNFKYEQRRLAPDAYRQFVQRQLAVSKQRLQQVLGKEVNLLAWPFGIHDQYLMQEAAAAGYLAAFTLEGRPVTRHDKLMALPRYLMVDAYGEKEFAHLLEQAHTIPASIIRH